jgi:hypothetical protein
MSQRPSRYLLTILCSTCPTAVLSNASQSLIIHLPRMTAVIFPHIGVATYGAAKEMGRVTAVNALLALQCKPLISEIPETRDLPFRPL